MNAIVQNQPTAFVYFLCSTGSAGSDRLVEQAVPTPKSSKCGHCGKTTNEAVMEGPIATQAHLAHGEYEIVRVVDPDDFDEVVVACRQIEATIAENFRDAAVRANYTGGTKTMSLALGYHAIQKSWTLQVNKAARINTIKVTAGDSAVRQNTESVDVERALASARELFARHDFDGAAGVLQSFIGDTRLSRERRAPLDELLGRCRIQAAIDRFDFEDAATRARSAQDSALEAELRRRIRAVSLCEDATRPWPQRDAADGHQLLTDLVEGANRCADRGHFDDAFARLYRATELCAQLRLRRIHSISTSSVDLAKVPDTAREWLLSKRDRADGPVLLGLRDAYRLLTMLSDPLGVFFDEHADDLQRYLEIRNYSWLAHGVTPVTKARWHDTGAPWVKWISEAQIVAYAK